jgi:site-specific DNA recombinase
MTQIVLGYVRVSTGEQGKGFSLAAQRKEILGYAAKNNFNTQKIFEDQSSATRLLQRQGLMDMLDAINPTIHGIIATEADRLSRDVFQYGWLSTHLAIKGVRILLINECPAITPAERAFAKIRAVFAEFETELRQARIVRGLKLAREQGRFMNRPPLGYKMENKQIVIDAEKQPLVLHIFEMASKGKSLSQISQALRIKRSTAGSILKNKFYIDDYLHGEHVAFIPQSLWDAAHRKRIRSFSRRYQ